MQTLTTLLLWCNNIGNEGARYFANALKQNQVTTVTSHTIIQSYFIQTLTILNLDRNEIGDQGAQHLADALKQNQVTSSTSLSAIDSLLHTDAHYTESL
jgi:Ran GTPase-activating protein (RanGAP) involved in mRNA processing and transport